MDAIRFPYLLHAAATTADRGYPQSANAHDTFGDREPMLGIVV